MDITRPYRLLYNNVWKSYPNLEAACWDLCVLLHTSGHLDVLKNGYFEETDYLGTKHIKRYCVELLFPYTKFIIKKLTKGDFNQTEFMSTLNKVEKIFNERINSEN